MKKTLSNRYREEAKRKIEELCAVSSTKTVAADPIFFVHQYADPQNQEVVAFISSLMAFGQVKSIHASLKKIFSVMGESPVAFLEKNRGGLSPKDQKALSEIIHRWIKGADIILLLSTLSEILHQYGSLKNLFLEGYRLAEEDITQTQHLFSKKILEMSGQKTWSRGFRYFFPSPIDGSPCKRLNMFLRWMVRANDGVDLGLWPEISASKLIIPLDTHIYQFAKKFKLSRHKNPNWKMAHDVTEFLKTLDPEDPVKYDFVICHYGMDVGWS